MRKNGCVNGELDARRYSLPVPIIGLYVGIASLACFLLMLFDILSGFRRKKRHVPCRLFSLNSVTLSLLSITTKLPTDLTSTMPRAIDQLSKLTGTVMICIAMGFFMPSLGLNRKSDSIGNMIALSILVVTVAVDVCLQIATGAIFSFIVEHLIVLTLMLLLLLGLWTSVAAISNQKDILMHRNKKLFATGDSSMLHRLKRWYVCSNVFHPQLILCKDFIYPVIAFMCFICSVVMLEVTVRSFTLEKRRFCQGSSDYKWSIWTVITSQNLTILAGTFCASYRSFMLIVDIDWGIMIQYVKRVDEYLTLLFQFVKNKLSIVFFKHLVKVIALLLYVAFFIIGYIPMFLYYFCANVIFECFCDQSNSDSKDDTSLSKWKKEFETLILEDEKISTCTMKACLKDMEVLEARNKKQNFPTHMLQLFSRPHSSRQSQMSEIQSIGEEVSKDDQYKVTCLTMIILVRVATISLPSTLSNPLKNALDEAFEIVYFIDKKINAGYFLNERKFDCAKLLWQGEDIDPRFLKKIVTRYREGSLDHAFWSVNEVYNILGAGLVDGELRVLMHFIERREYRTVDDFSNCLEQIFIDMLHFFLSQLPKAICMEIAESSFEECEERSRTLLNFLYRLEPLVDKVQWSFPEDSGITSLLEEDEFFSF